MLKPLSVCIDRSRERGYTRRVDGGGRLVRSLEPYPRRPRPAPLGACVIHGGRPGRGRHVHGRQYRLAPGQCARSSGAVDRAVRPGRDQRYRCAATGRTHALGPRQHRGREPGRCRRHDRRCGRGAGRTGRQHPAAGQCGHPHRRAAGDDCARLRPGQGLHAGRHHRGQRACDHGPSLLAGKEPAGVHRVRA